jgi:hypothetical protein
MLTSLKSYTPMTLKVNYTSFKDSNEVWFGALCFYFMYLVLNDFCERLKILESTRFYALFHVVHKRVIIYETLNCCVINSIFSNVSFIHLLI